MIRRARAADIAALLSIEKDCFEAGLRFSAAAMRYHVSRNMILVYENESQAVGYIILSPLTKTKKRRVYSIGVLSKMRGKSIGKRLMLEAEVRSRARTIVLEVDENNTPAIDLYSGLGYTVFGRYYRYYGKTDALRMKKDIKK